MKMEENCVLQEGFPFNKDIFSQSTNAGIKSHLEELAKKHPKLERDLCCPPWGNSVDGNWEKAYNVPIVVEKSSAGGSETGTASSPSSHQQPMSPSLLDNWAQPEITKDTLGQHGIRNTVNIPEHIPKANQSKVKNEPKCLSSAPPDTPPVMNSKKEPRRFTSKIEITLVNPFEHDAPSILSNESAFTTPTTHINANTTTNSLLADNDNQQASFGGTDQQIPLRTDPQSSSQKHVEHIPKMSQIASNTTLPHSVSLDEATSAQTCDHHSPQMGCKQPQMHQIPIFIEGRNKPVVLKNVETPVEQRSCMPDQAAPLKHKLNSGGIVDDTASSKSGAPHKHNQMPSNERKVPNETPVASTAATPETQLAPSLSDQVTASTQVRKPDPLQSVQEVQQEVNDLTAHVEQHSGNSRIDKDYLYLDEMLTRNLIKLDTIEVESNEQLRITRKDVIRSIQKSIALLESKVPVAKHDTEELATNAADAHPSDGCDAVMDMDVNGVANGSDQNAKNKH